MAMAFKGQAPAAGPQQDRTARQRGLDEASARLAERWEARCSRSKRGPAPGLDACWPPSGAAGIADQVVVDAAHFGAFRLRSQ